MERHEIKVGKLPIVEEVYENEYKEIDDLKPEMLENMDYLMEKLCQMMKGKLKAGEEIDWSFGEKCLLEFPSSVVEAAHIMIAVSMFKSFRDQGLLTEEEFEEFAEYGEMMWKRILYGDNMVTKRVVLKEKKNE